jgi:MFS family permease
MSVSARVARSADATALRRLTVLVGAAVLLDTTFLAVVAPLLPGLSHSLHLSKQGAGILTASYAVGMLVASYPAGILAVRLGPRVAIYAGLSLLFASTVAFALLHSAAGLDLARFVEGIGGACSWDAGVAWLVALAPPERRGAVIGQAVSAAVAGAVAGPAVGALASLTGRPALFIGLAALALVLVAVFWSTAIPAGGPGVRDPAEPSPASAVLALVRRPLGVGALWLMCLPAIVSGTLTVLGSLRLHSLGADAGVIGATFIAAALVETVISSVVGGLSDRHGRLLPMVGSLAAAGVALACFGVASTAVVLIVIICLTALGTGAAWTPSMALLSDLSESVGLNQALGAGLMNMAWAAGQIIGEGGSGALAKATDDTVTTVLIGAVCLLSAAVLLRAHATAEPPVAGGSE